ncbi:hypothetical protein [Psychrobacter sp. ANT_WB68]|uniref:hypothetical protein n=1 Tax=Psychrobacter sp. ANT_WB68 TaxID=2597355 RepID=UPI0011F3EC30|nr:hypothetical protein [Psychrobacter sp. ANT_WB68]KAA0915817.1 hypothetical protein FQ084_04595 [Psychrobacter sp. ANT_WB68]
MLTKFFYSTMKGAPNLASEWGSLLSVLKGCLLNGFNEQQVSSVVIADGIATITLGSNHGFIEHQVVAISGADQVAFNTEHRVLSATTTTITVNVVGITSATGMMTLKTAPLGWTEKFTGVNKSVFTAKDTTKNRFVLRVDNSLPAGYDTTWAKFARITIAEYMVDIDNFGSFAKAPTAPNNTNTNEQGNGVTGASGVYGWAKWYHGVETSPYLKEQSTTGQSPSLEWELVGDDSCFYFWAKITNSNGRATYAFTPINSVSNVDSFNCFLSATDGLRPANANGEYFPTGLNSANCQWKSLDTSGKFILRDYTGIGNTHEPCGLFSLNTGNNQQVSGRSDNLPSPNKPDNSIILHDIYVKTNSGIRGTLPTIKWINNRWTYNNKAVLNKQQGKYLILGANYHNEGMTSFFAFELRG